MIRLRYLTALTVLAGLLALPLLGLASGDACCRRGSPCAPGAAPCDSLGPIPCCAADRGVAGTTLGATAVDVGCPAPAELRAPARDRVPQALEFERAERIGTTSPLRLSVVLRI